MLTSGLLPIHSLTLVPNACVGTSVYLWNEQKASAVKFIADDQPITDVNHSFLLGSPSQRVFVEEAGYSSYKNYLDEQLDHALCDRHVPSIVKTTVITEYLHGRLSEAFQKRSAKILIETCVQLSDKLSRLGVLFDMQGRELVRALKHDGSFVTHAVNTAMYAFLLSRARGYSSESLAEISAGAMLHDIGKIDAAMLDPKVTAKSGAQDWTERNVKTHPTEGFRRLCLEPNIKETYLLMCYQHHERLDGTGFPVGLVADEIDESSKICAVANRFDGLTSQRVHRNPMTRAAALRVMESERNTVLDREAFRCLDQLLS